MGTSVCLHSDELVSKRPLERAWHSPMTHSLLFLQDDTQCQPQPVSTVRWLWLQRGCCWLLSPSLTPCSSCKSQETLVTQERVTRLSITSLVEAFYQVLVVDKHLLGCQPPSGIRA